MSDHSTAPGDVGLRPYLLAGRASAPDVEPVGNVAEDWSVRAYAITGGRVRTDVQLGFESMLQATQSGLAARPELAFERASIIDLCTADALSVAELSARLNIPIGVIRVLAADLVSDELLRSFVTSQNVADDVLLISRLISGVRSL